MAGTRAATPWALEQCFSWEDLQGPSSPVCRCPCSFRRRTSSRGSAALQAGPGGLGNQPAVPLLPRLRDTSQPSSRASPPPAPAAAAGDGVISIINLRFLQPQVGKAGSSQEGETFPWFYIEAALDDAQPSGGDTEPWCHFRGRRVLSGVPQRPCHMPGGDRRCPGRNGTQRSRFPVSALPAPPVTPPGTTAGRLRPQSCTAYSRRTPQDRVQP